MHAWLAKARDRIAAETGQDAATLDLDPERSEAILELARIAAHESGERTNAPLVCFLAGLAAGRGGADAEDVLDAAAGRPPSA